MNAPVPAVALLIMLFGVPGTLAAGDLPVISLCEALHSIQPGEQRVLRTSGVYSAGFEHSTLEALDCTRNVQPVTWLEFQTGAKGSSELFASERKNTLTLITVTGTLYGPGLSDPGPSWPYEIRARLALQRYGHLNGYRTKFLVSSVERIDATASGAIHQALEASRSWAPRGNESFPIVDAGQLPTYPDLALRTNTQGEVRLELIVSDGRVVDTVVLSEGSLLSTHAVRQAMTWRFANYTSGRFQTKFSYRLEERAPSENQNARVEMQLPESVRVTAPFYRW
jgi:hypothetical protein